MTTQTEEWEKELWALNCLNYDNRTHGAKELESFIRTLLTQERTRLKEEMMKHFEGQIVWVSNNSLNQIQLEKNKVAEQCIDALAKINK